MVLSRVALRTGVVASIVVACGAWPAAGATLDRSIQRGWGCALEGDDAADPIVLHARTVEVGSCAFLLTDRPNGRRLAASALVGLRRGDRTNVALIVTQHRQSDVLAHQFVTVVVEPGRETRLDLSAYVMPDTEQVVIVVQAIGADSDVELDDLSVVASAGAIAPGTMARGPDVYLDHALAYIARHALAFDAAGRSSLFAEARRLVSGATTSAETYPAIRHVLAHSDPSGHSRLIPATGIADFVDYPTGPPFGIEVGSLDDRIGYLRIPSWTSLRSRDRTRFSREVRRMLAQAAGAASEPALVLDLRADGGGAFGALLEGACPLFEPHRALGAYRDRAGRRDEWHCRAESPAATKRLRVMPVAVLIGPDCGSAGEMLAIALRGRANTVLIGARTAGVTTGVKGTRLGDGAILTVAASLSVERSGRIVERFVDPDIQVPGATEASSASDDAGVRAALDWIAAQPGRPRPRVR